MCEYRCMMDLCMLFSIVYVYCYSCQLIIDKETECKHKLRVLFIFAALYNVGLSKHWEVSGVSMHILKPSV